MRWMVAIVIAALVVVVYLGLVAPILSLTGGSTPGPDAPPTSLAVRSSEIAPTPSADVPSNLPPTVSPGTVPAFSSTPTTSTEAESGKKQLMEVLDAVRAEFANSGGATFEIQGENEDGGAADTASTAGRADEATIFRQQFEAQIKAAMEAIDANPAQIDRQAGVVATEKPDRRPKHRRRRH